ncbi:DEAD/DEAH box helicase [Polynucleobacter sp. 73C-SIWE]|uniref:DEAD/DEAH box helicase n=1 Tax=Polynucleobacter sp. 73C-SIWE TaxID=2689098 RepID=UPI001C0AD235|nr:DEAD/DEAH box helicase [Polynucleobacter sp. 73C-SIWE]MBU3579547.1 DEAD/DEAH box helicase [Polynucleobacter sp. 73C-SIWE]
MINTETEITSATGADNTVATSDSSAVPAATPPATITFADFGLDPKIQKAVLEQGYTIPTPIQAQSIPHVLAGSDLMGAAQTGTGKTAAFVLPIIQKILRHASNSASPARHPIRALVLTPTRELAVQVAENAASYSKHTDLRAAVVYGGVDMKEQVGILRNGLEILIATPGRLLDHIGSKVANLSQVEILVLDEADRMLDMGFLPDLQRIINLIPAQRQTLLFSATFSPEIKKLAQSYLRTPVTVEVARQNAAADTVKQVVHMVASADKQRAIVKVLEERTRKGLSRQCIIFTNSRLGCARLSRALERDGIKAGAIHGDKSQGERTLTLDAFKSGVIEALVATDVAARGLDIPDMPCVINHELPYNAEDFIHRIGRTGRAGSTGDAIALVDASEKRLLDDIEKLMKRKLDIKPLPEGAPSQSRVSNYSSVSSSSNTASAKMSDPFFYKPYEPSAAPAVAEGAKPEEKKVGITPAKPAVGALLGGFKKK